MRPAWICLLCACGPAAMGRSPHIVDAGPTGPGIPPDELVAAVTFSDPVDPAGVADGRRLALCRATERERVTALVDAPEGIAAGAPVVAARVVLADGGRRAELHPLEPLEPFTGYALVVGSRLTAGGRPVLDTEGRRRASVSLFETGPLPDRAPPRAHWVLPPHGPVPRNLRWLRLAFDEPVTGRVVLSPGPPSEPVTSSPRALGLDLQGPLPGGWLAPSLAEVYDTTGNRAESLEPLPVGACEDRFPPEVAEGTVMVTTSDLGVRVEAAAGELARLGVEVLSPVEEPSCGRLPPFPEVADQWGEVLPCPNADPCGAGGARCSLRADVAGLCPGQRLLLRVAAEDLAGNRSAWGPWHEAATAPGVARPVITEVLADAAAPEAGGEYAELANLGTADADLAGYALVKRSASGALSRCSLVALAGPIPPGGHALVVGGAYDGRYRLPAGTPLYRCGATALAGGLANDRAPALQLEAPGGEVRSSFGTAAPALRCPEHSVERIHPAGADATVNSACASAGIGTPGTCNGATPAEECPRRPW